MADRFDKVRPLVEDQFGIDVAQLMQAKTEAATVEAQKKAGR